ncbi:MAG: N-glycosylase/DNA lyase [Thermoplasmata archaeon]
MSNHFTVRKRQVIKELKALYLPVKDKIRSRLNEFKRIWKRGNEKDIFAELVFCILTPQSKARSCDKAVDHLIERDLLFGGNKGQIARELKGNVRFHKTKAKHIIEARKKFMKEGRLSIKHVIARLNDPKKARDWLVQNVKGIGYKEAGHFLRNIGRGEDLAILDRHILKNLKSLEVINEIPTSLSKKRYFEIEKRMKEFAENVKIPMSYLDLLLWYKETKEIFK